VVKEVLIELSHEAANRGLVEHHNPGLEELVPLLFHCFIDKDPKLRKSNWSMKDPSNAQIKYAVVDLYAHLQCCYSKLMTMPYVDPEGVPPPGSMEDIAVGNRLFLYLSNKKNVVATGTFMGQAEKINMFGKKATIKGHAKYTSDGRQGTNPTSTCKVPTKLNHKAFLVLFDKAGKKQ
jgi:hypothetical protein